MDRKRARKIKLSELDLNEISIRAKCGESKSQLTQDFGVNRQNIYFLIVKQPHTTEPLSLERVGV